jgi:hypothetical protein
LIKIAIDVILDHDRNDKELWFNYSNKKYKIVLEEVK